MTVGMEEGTGGGWKGWGRGWGGGDGVCVGGGGVMGGGGGGGQFEAEAGIPMQQEIGEENGFWHRDEGLRCLASLTGMWQRSNITPALLPPPPSTPSTPHSTSSHTHTLRASPPRKETGTLFFKFSVLDVEQRDTEEMGDKERGDGGREGGSRVCFENVCF